MDLEKVRRGSTPPPPGKKQNVAHEGLGWDSGSSNCFCCVATVTDWVGGRSQVIPFKQWQFSVYSNL